MKAADPMLERSRRCSRGREDAPLEVWVTVRESRHSHWTRRCTHRLRLSHRRRLPQSVQPHRRSGWQRQDRSLWPRGERSAIGRGFLQRYSDNAHAVMEATRNWTVIFDWLDELVDEVVLAHPLKVKAIAEAKIKTDKIDATILSHLLRADLVPAAHAPGHRARQVRLALRDRMFYVRLRTIVKNRIVTAFDRYREQTAALKRCSDLFGQPGGSSSPLSSFPKSTGSGPTAASPSSTTLSDGSSSARRRSRRSPKATPRPAVEDNSGYRRILRPSDRRRG